MKRFFAIAGFVAALSLGAPHAAGASPVTMTRDAGTCVWVQFPGYSFCMPSLHQLLQAAHA